MSYGLLRAAVLYLWAAVALAVPSCEVFEARDYRRYKCRQFRTASHFAEHVPHEPSPKPTWFSLHESNLSALPPSAFAGLNVTVLELRSVELGRLDPSQTESPFAGLEDSLRKLTFSLGTMPSSWLLLSSLRRLEELDIVHYARLRLTHLASFNRNWLPSPAPRFTSLDLPTNKLTSEQDFAPIRDKVAVVDLMFNPVHCDCNVSFILDYPTSWHYFMCAAPRDVKNTYASNLQHKQLKCQVTT
ncbi:hypothetical protein MRX96_022683 [Rhipicephalus microplus]